MMTIRTKVDLLAHLDARLADIKAQREALATELKALAGGGTVHFEGAEHVVTISHTTRKVTDWKTVAAKLEPSWQLVSAHTSHSPVCTLKVTGKAKLVA
jgi:hypothetical protein